MEFPNIFRGDYRLLAIVPLLLVAISLFFIPTIKMGVDFRGGTLISLTLDNQIDSADLEERLAAEGLDADVRIFETAVGYKAEIEFPQSDALVNAEGLKDEFEKLLPEATNLEIMAEMNESQRAEYEAKRAEIDAVADEMFVLAGVNTKAELIGGVNDLEDTFMDAYKKVYSNYQISVTQPIDKYIEYTSISVQTVSPMLSTHFIEIAIRVAVLSAILSAVFVFAFFRVVVPSIAVITGAACDIIIALGAMGLFGIPFTLPAFAALLMLVGFSLDTDILLTMRMLKRKGDPREKAHDAMKTGLTMSVAAVIAFGTLFVLAALTHIPTYYEISAVALAGLVGDMIATWGINAVMLLWYAERRGEA
ncbi:hypothetical protein H0O02_01135 [Candidatus Micrarchaeota archaeon]|nr:hypothetical protein [Candidatus Micrarchaeota archaeon]